MGFFVLPAMDAFFKVAEVLIYCRRGFLFGVEVFAMRKTVRYFIGGVSSPTSVTALVLVVAIILVLASIIGVDLTFAGNRLLLLSTTTTVGAKHNLQQSVHSVTSENSTAVEIVEKTASDDTISQADKPENWETVRMRVTAYCACRRCCGRNSDGRTACGHRIRSRDVFVAADKRYRFGTEVIIPGYNNGNSTRILDRGRVIKGNRLDVFFNSHRRARKWGVKYLDVKVKT